LQDIGKVARSYINTGEDLHRIVVLNETTANELSNPLRVNFGTSLPKKLPLESLIWCFLSFCSHISLTTIHSSPRNKEEKDTRQKVKGTTEGLQIKPKEIIKRRRRRVVRAKRRAQSPRRIPQVLNTELE
jgi:hypothetical protein